MFFSKKNKAEHRYYLLPGMGRSNRRRHRQTIRWGIAVGIVASILMGVLLYFMNQI